MGKKLALMQPYFFPYIGYYTIMKHVDCYVYFDTAQYMKGGWINRNRILKPNGMEWQYITLPLKKHSHENPIKDIKVDYDLPVLERIMSRLEHYKKQAPYYKQVSSIVNEALQECQSISQLNIRADRLVCEYLGIKIPQYILSEVNVGFIEAECPDEWGLNVCMAFGNIDEYWNAPGGVHFYDTNKYLKNGIKIYFVKTELRRYEQKIPKGEFLPGLSILDVMMFNSPKEINDMLDDYSFV